MLFYLFETSIGTFGDEPGKGFGPFSKIENFSQAVDIFQGIISKILGFLTIVGSLWFMLQFVLGAFSWINAGGNKEALKKAQDKILHAVIGLVILVAAYALISVIGSLVGLNILNPGETLNLLK